jgi:DNA-binding HxlR family transcriptional regulator
MYNLTPQRPPAPQNHASTHDAAVLAALQRRGTWQQRATLNQILGFPADTLDRSLRRLLARQQIQRRGQPYTYEYALTTAEA